MKDLVRDLGRILLRDRAALVGACVVSFYVLVAIFGPYVVHASHVNNPANAYEGPSLSHLLGTDYAGRGVLTEIILGTRPIMEVAVLAAVVTVLVGVTVGLTSGYLGGPVDYAVMRVVDIFLTIPPLPLVVVVASVVRSSNPFVLAAILSLLGWARLARVVRSQALSLRSADFVDAARSLDLPLRNMVTRQLLPNVGPYVAIHFLLDVTGAIYAEVGLFLLGIAPLSGVNWGIMINLAMSEGALYSSRSMLYLFSPMAAIVILQLGFVFFSRALDQLFNPRLRTAS